MADQPSVRADNAKHEHVAEALSSLSASHEKNGKPQQKPDKDANQSQQYKEESKVTHTNSGTVLKTQGKELRSRSNSPAPQDDDAGSGVDRTDEDNDSKFQKSSKEFLIGCVFILKKELAKQKEGYSHLLEQYRALQPFKKECEAQREMIASQKKEIDLLQAENASSLEKIQLLKKELADKEYQERVDRAKKAIEEESPKNVNHPGMSSGKLSPKFPGGTVIGTQMGPQILCKSSSISSVGFSSQKIIPLDFLGGPDVQRQLLHQNSSQYKRMTRPQNVNLTEEAEHDEVLQMAKEQARLSQLYRDKERDQEEKLWDRLKALKSRR